MQYVLIKTIPKLTEVFCGKAYICIGSMMFNIKALMPLNVEHYYFPNDIYS